MPRPWREAVLKPIARRGLARLDRQLTPSRLILYVTDVCNAACSHCFYGRHLNPAVRDELSLAELEQLAQSLRAPLQSLLLTGGEPTLRKELPDICRIFDRANGTRLATITTNGIQTDRITECVEEILSSSRLRLNVHVSLDGLQETHDRLRGVQGNFEKATRTARELRELRERHRNLNIVSVITSIASENVDELEALIEFVRDELGLFHKFQFVRGSHSDVLDIDSEILSDFDPVDPGCTPPTPDDMETAFRIIRSTDRLEVDSLVARRQLLLLSHAMKVKIERERPVRCLAGKIDGVIYTSGEVAVCEMTQPFANLRDWQMDFHRLWTSPEAEERRSQTQRCFCTHPCNLSTSMSYDVDSLVQLSDRR